MSQYWALRLHEALELSRKESNPAARRAHLMAADHYRSLQKFCAASETGARWAA